MNEWLTFKIKDGCQATWHVNKLKNFEVNFEKVDNKKKLFKVEWSSIMLKSNVNIWKIIKVHTHTFKPKKKIFFLNILKIFHNTIEVYEKIFKVECTKHKPIRIELIWITQLHFNLK